MTRHAVYYAPTPGSRLHEFGARWLGRDAATGRPVKQPHVGGIDLAAVTQAPRIYGFHATVKAPFRLADGISPADLERAASEFAASSKAVEGLRLVVARIGPWLALVPEARSPALLELAFDVVRRFDRFRAPLSPKDRSRRRPEGLTPRQRELLDLWGYPYVGEAFEFHMTLAGPCDADILDRLQPVLHDAWNESEIGAVDIDAIAIFEQSGEDAPFIMRSRHGLTRTGGRMTQDGD